MANLFKREPIDHSDLDTWGPYELAQNRPTLGACSCLLYDDGGTLKISKGMIGFDDGTNKAVCIIDTITTISIAGVTAGNWAKIEVALSGTTPAFTAADIVGANDSTVIPAGFTGAWDYDKQGYYISATKRCIGLCWVTAGGALSGIVHTFPGFQGYIGASATTEFRLIKDVNLLSMIAATITTLTSTTIGTTTGNITNVIAAVLKASGAGGLSLKDDADNVGIFLEDGGQVGIGGNVAPAHALDVTGRDNTTLGRNAKAKLTGSKTENEVFDWLSPYIPNTNDTAELHLSYTNAGTAAHAEGFIATRTNATVITFDIFDFGAGVTTDSATDGGGGSFSAAMVLTVI